MSNSRIRTSPTTPMMVRAGLLPLLLRLGRVHWLFSSSPTPRIRRYSAMPASPFHHIAVNVDAETQALVEGRLKKTGFREPNFYVLEHGYCRSIYATDPNGMILELTVDNVAAAAGSEQRRITAHNDLKRWLAGDHRSNNTFRAATHQPA